MRKTRINVEYGGRCGNQMFQYAFARVLQEKYYADSDMCFSFKNVIKSGSSKDGWVDSLSDFNIVPISAEKARMTFGQYIISAFYVLMKKMSLKAELKLQKLMNKAGIYALRQSCYVPVVKSSRHNIYIRGRFEAHEYFDDIRDQLIEEFTPKKDVLEHNKDLLNMIEGSDSVCVTIRRGDFLDKGNEKFNVCSGDYFVDAMNAIKKEVPNAKFFVFSDCIDEIKAYYNFPDDVVYEHGNDPVWEKLRLMYSCKHFIISNSTFSWWAQYLGKNKNKIVYAPKVWRKDDDCSGLYTDYMRLL